MKRLIQQRLEKPLIQLIGRDSDKKDLDAQVKALNETILNVFRNYVPNKYITVDDKDLVWMNEIKKSKMKTKNKLYKQYIQNGKFQSDFVLF